MGEEEGAGAAGRRGGGEGAGAGDVGCLDADDVDGGGYDKQNGGLTLAAERRGALEGRTTEALWPYVIMAAVDVEVMKPRRRCH